MLIIKYLYVLFRTSDAPLRLGIVCAILSIAVLMILHHFMKGKMERLWCVLCVLPMIAFLIFHHQNRILGMGRLTLQRFAPIGVVALLILLWGVVIFFKRSYKAYAILVCIFSISWLTLGLIFDAVCVTYVYVGNNSSHGFEKSVERTINDLATAYVLRDTKEIDFVALKDKYLPMAREAEMKQDKVAMLLTLYELRYDLYDGHVRVRTENAEARQKAAEILAGNDYGFSMFRDEDGNFMAVLVEEDCEASRLGIQNGSIITKWDGVPVASASDEVKCIDVRYVFSYRENERIFQPIFLAGHGGDTVQVTFLDENAKEKTVSVSAIGNYYDRRTEAIQKFLGQPADNENFHACMINEHVGYLRITEESYKNDPTMDIIKCSLAGYSKELYEDLNARLGGLKEQGMDCLIIDLRNNDGGYSYMTKSVIGLFSDEAQPSDLGYYLDGKYKTALPEKAYGDAPWKDLPLMVLVNAETASSGDVMTYLLQRYGNATLIGNSTTWGCAQSTGGLSVLTEGEFSFLYPIITTPGEDNLPIIDAGSDRKAKIILDHQVTYDKEAVLDLFGPDPSDLVMEKALELLSRR